jgi:hypothetical protein
MQVGRGKAQAGPSFGSSLYASLHSIGPGQQPPRQIHPAFGEQATDSARTYALMAESHLRHFVGKKPKILADSPQQFDVAFTIVTKREATAKINFFCVQSILDNVAKKILRSSLRKTLIETDYDRLLNTEHAKPFNFLIESLQERWRRFGMQHRARVGIESYHSRDRAGLAGSFHYRAHDQLVAQVKTIKHTERQDRWSLNFGIVGSVKESHKRIAGLPIEVD